MWLGVLYSINPYVVHIVYMYMYMLSFTLREKAVENGVEEDADSGTAEGGMPPSAEGDEEARETRRSARKREERVG